MRQPPHGFATPCEDDLTRRAGFDASTDPVNTPLTLGSPGVPQAATSSHFSDT